MHGSVDEVTELTRTYCNRLDGTCNLRTSYIQYIPVEKHPGVRSCAGEYSGPCYQKLLKDQVG